MFVPVKTAKIPIILHSVLLALPEQFCGQCFSIFLACNTEMDILPTILIISQIIFVLFAAKITYLLVYL